MDLLGGIRVLSFNHFFMGPAGMQYLADLGADVISVEPIDGAFQRKWGGANKRVDGQTMLQLAANRNKRSLALDLKSPAGNEIAQKLAARADVIGENYRPGVMKKFGLDYEAVRAVNPKVIYAAASGFGQDGPYADRPGQDLVIQALSGLAAINGKEPDGARAVGVSAADHHGGALFALGILAALVHRARTGKGCRVDVNLLSAAIDLQVESFTCYLNGEKPASVRQPRHIAGWYFGAPYGIYRTVDGHMALSLSSLTTVGEALGLPSLAGVDDAEGYERREEIAEQIAASLAERPNAAWIEALTKHGVWHAPVNDYDAVVADPQVRHNGNFVTVAGATGAPVTLVRHPVRYDGAAPGVTLPPQTLGAQTREVLKNIGYGDAEIDDLAAKGIVGLPQPAADSTPRGSRRHE